MFSYYRDKKQQAHGKLHVSKEKYNLDNFGHSLRRD
jgi:hypothetical protein